MNQTMRQQSPIPKRRVASKRARLFNCERSALFEERFQDFNTKYFKGRLPKYEVYLCSTYGNLFGQCFSEKKRILIVGDRLFRRTLAMLLHEMIHIKVSWHRDRFAKEWNRICGMGAPVGKWEDPLRNWDADWAPDGQMKLNKQNVRDAIRHYLRGACVSPLMCRLEDEFSVPQGRIKKKVNIPKLLNEAERANRRSESEAGKTQAA